MQKIIKGIMLHERKEPAIMYIANELKSFQSLVRGRIETSSIREDIVAIMNEEGRLMSMKPNPVFNRFVGPVFLVGVNGDEFVDFPEQEIESFLEYCKDAYHIKRRDDERYYQSLAYE